MAAAGGHRVRSGARRSEYANPSGTGRLVSWAGTSTCIGRTASGERFDAGELRQRTEVWQQGRRLWCEYARLAGGDPMLASHRGPGGLHGQRDPDRRGQGPAERPAGTLPQHRAGGGRTLGHHCIAAACCWRAIWAHSSEAALHYFIALWTVLRPAAGRAQRGAAAHLAHLRRPVTTSPDAIAALFVDAHDSRAPVRAPRPISAPATAQDAYRVQDLVFAALYPGQRAGAWKVGGPRPDVEPTAAPIPAARLYAQPGARSRARISHDRHRGRRSHSVSAATCRRAPRPTARKRSPPP